MELVYLDPYHFFNRTIMPKNPTIMKVGVCGTTADLVMAKRMYPESKVIGYEADPNNYKAMQPSTKGCVDSFINQAISVNPSIILHRFTNSVSHSVYPRHEKEPNCVFVDKIEIPAVTLLTAMKDRNIDRISLLVLNCEGAELEIMRMLKDEELRSRIDQICVSFHNPRIYSDERMEKFVSPVRQHYHVVRGDCPRGGIPDHLMIRKV